MTKDKLIKELELGLKNPNVPETFKDKIRVKLEALKAEESKKETKTTDVRSLIKYKNKFKVGDVVVLKGETTLEKEITSYKQNSKGEFVYKAKYVSKPEATGEWNEEELELILQETAKPKVGDIITFVESSNVDAPKLKGTVEKINQLGLVVFIDGKQYEVRKLIDIKIVGKDKKIKPSSATPIKKVSKKYYRNREIKSVTVLENGKKVTYAGKDVLNGANFFKEGGVLTSKATYVPIRNIVEVTFEDGSKDKPRNGYHIKNGATPIMEHGGEIWQPIVQLVPLELEPLSSQLKSYTGDALSAGNYTNEEGKDYSTAPGEIIIHKESGRKFEMPEKIYNYVDGFNLVFDKRNNKIVTWEEGKLVAVVKDGKLDFTNKDESISINKSKVESEFEKGFIPEKPNEKWAYIAVENKLQKLYAVAEDLEDDKTTAAWKTNQEKIKKYEDYLHRLERKYAVGGTVELPEGSLQHFENYYLEKGGKVGRLPKHVMDFQENDYKKMVQDYPDYPFYSVKNGTIQEIFSEKTEELVAKWNSKKKELTVYNPKYNSEVIVWLKENSFLTSDQVYEIDEMFEEEEYKLGGQLLGAWKRERKYVNKSQDYEVRYAKGKNRSGYKKLAKGGEVGDYAKVPVGYNMTHYGLIKKVITNDVLYPEKGYEIAGIGDILHPEQFEIISSAEFNKLKKQSTEVKPNHFLIIEEEFEKGGSVDNRIKLVVLNEHTLGYIDPITPNTLNILHASVLKGSSYQNLSAPSIPKNGKIRLANPKDFDDFRVDFTGYDNEEEYIYDSDKKTKLEKGGVLSKGDQVKHQETKKHGKVISVKELNGLEDEVVVEFEDGTTQTLNSFDVEKVLEIKAKKTYDPNSNLTEEEWKAKHNIQNYGKGGKTEKGQGKGAIFAIAREIRKPGEKWQDAVARAGKLNK